MSLANIKYRYLGICLIFLLSLCTSSLLGQEVSGRHIRDSSFWRDSPYMLADDYPAKPEINLHSYLLLDMRSGQILARDSDQMSHPMASLTKMMTAYIIMNDLQQKKYNITDRYLVSADMFLSLPYDASRMGLVEGDTPSIDDLLAGLIIGSGNDAAIMLALISRGSMTAFVKEMNYQSKLFGFEKTNFADSSGLSPYNVSTAYEIAELAYFILEKYADLYLSYSKQKYITWNAYQKRSTNLLLNTYDGVDSFKTGYTDEAGFNFVASAERSIYDGTDRRVLAVVLGVDASTIAEGVVKRAKIAEQLLDYAFENFDTVHIAYPMYEVRIWGAKNKFAYVEVDKQEVLLPQSWLNALSMTFRYDNTYLWAPLSSKQTIGYISVSHSQKNQAEGEDNSVQITELSMHMTQDIEKSGWIKRTVSWISLKLHQLFSSEKLMSVQ